MVPRRSRRRRSRMTSTKVTSAKRAARWRKRSTWLRSTTRSQGAGGAARLTTALFAADSVRRHPAHLPAGRRHAELADQLGQVGPLQAQEPGRLRAIAPRPAKGREDQPALELLHLRVERPAVLADQA